MAEGGTNVVVSAERWQRIVAAIVAMTVALVVVVVVLAVFVVQNRGLAEQGREAKVAVCSYRSDLSDRVAASRRSLAFALKYQREHPQGTQLATTRQIQDAIRNDRKTLASQRQALSSLRVLRDCPRSVSAPASAVRLFG